MKDKPNRVTAMLKVVVAGEFYDDDATEETLRYIVEQDLEDEGFEVDVSLLKEQETIVRCKDCKYGGIKAPDTHFMLCIKPYSGSPLRDMNYYCADGERQ